MNERVKLASKKPEGKNQGLISHKQNTDHYHSRGSLVDHILFLQRSIGNQAVQRFIKSGIFQAKPGIGHPVDIYEQEADRVAEKVISMSSVSEKADETRIQRECPKCEEKILQTLMPPNNIPEISPDIESHINALKGSGQPLPESARTFFEPRFGYDFGNVKMHADSKASEYARAVNARAFTIGTDIVFGEGQYDQKTIDGRKLLAHELTHVVQQAGDTAQPSHALGSLKMVDESPVRNTGMEPTLCRSAVTAGEPTDTPHGESVPQMGGYVAPVAAPPAATVPRPETCPPPEGMSCPAAVSSPGAVTNTLIFPVNSATLNAKQKAEIDATAASWHAAGGSVTVRVDGYASAEGECRYNWGLSCRRAQAVAAELESPTDGSPGVPNGDIEVFAHGESAEAGLALAPNRNATISIPVPPPPPPPPSPPVCTFPVTLGIGRTGCGSCGTCTDFTHFDFPSISIASEAKLAAWAAAHPPLNLPIRSLVTDAECEAEMDAVLVGLAGGAGHAAFSRFAAGTGGTETHGSSSTLGAMALVSGSFLRTVARVKADIEAQLAAQAASGVLNPCALSATPPATSFGFSDGIALKAVIGGTHGERLFATGFTGSIPMRSYSIDLRFLVCDNFGVDEADLYAPGLFAFWVLQHERSATLYAPFINELDLPVTVSGKF